MPKPFLPSICLFSSLNHQWPSVICISVPILKVHMNWTSFKRSPVLKGHFLAHLAKGRVSFCHHLSSINFSHFNLLLWNPSAKWWPFKTGDLLKEVQFIWTFLWQDKKKVTSLTGLTVLANNSIFKVGKYTFASLTIINPKVTCVPFLCL
jgi:hypothetical protein